MGEDRADEAAALYLRAAELAPESDELVFWAGLAIAQKGDVAAAGELPRSAARPRCTPAGLRCSSGFARLRVSRAAAPNWSAVPDRYLPGVPCWIELRVPDPAAAEAFYAGLFGWELEDGVARLDGRTVAGVREGYGAAWTTAIRVADDVAATAGVAAGANEVPGGLADPGGAMFTRLPAPVPSS